MQQVIDTIPSWVKSKYAISLAAFLVVLFFLDKNDLFTQLDRKRELRELQQTKAHYSTQIEAEKKELELLKNNPATIEKYAREKYLMKRENEDLFLIAPKPTPGSR
ncbi:MAG: septum formation initiator family protein [Chitinophagales bacterium]|jgi:cell division protein FtsB|nr:septum formation initiator family protein [Chitinophagales bacterium]